MNSLKEISQLDDALIVCKALSSELRIDIIKLLNKHHKMNLNELSECLGVTNGAMTSHIKILLESGIIDIEHTSGKRGSQKTCSLKENQFLINLNNQKKCKNSYETEIPIGQYSNYLASPTCGICTTSAIIGEVDDNRYFDSPMHVDAGILWLSKGFLEYRIPNYLKMGQTPTELQFSFEISSEAPGTQENWPSDIYFYFNDIPLGYWTSPGDFGNKRGFYSPNWWPSYWNQYGLLKLLSINATGTYLDGQQISNVTIQSLKLDSKSELKLKFAVMEQSKHIGGMTLFGKGFGNHNQNIKVQVTYEINL